MTSQTLVPQIVSPASQIALSNQCVSVNCSIPSERCASELQHLQAETAALLQQLQALKQERLASLPDSPAI